MPLNETEAALAQLATAPTPGVLADILFDLRIVGRPRDSWCCPIARYLEFVTGHRHQVGLLLACRTFLSGGLVDKGTELPPVVTAFIARFDQGDYPNLVEQ